MGARDSSEIYFPYVRQRDLTPGVLLTDGSGAFAVASTARVARWAAAGPAPADREAMIDAGLASREPLDLDHLASICRSARREATPGPLAYLILVPTLRCDLDCSYCQVSRVAERATGFDWSEETLARVLDFLDRLETDQVKIEFQGGEPLLRLDLLTRVRDFCRERFERAEFVVCTNLQAMTPAKWAFLDADDTYVSTSFDGDRVIHARQRTQTTAAADVFLGNLQEALARFGQGHVSALPTIDMAAPPAPETLLDAYAELGFRTIYLRPVNHQGFARKRHKARDLAESWTAYHLRFIDLLVERNAQGGPIFEEFYFSHCLKRVLRPGADSHVDLRNPNRLGEDHLVVDHDGRFYPTDEARMLSRVGVIDLSIGDLSAGLDADRIAALNAHASNADDPACSRCVYQAFCGVDRIDDLSRYGRIDVSRHETEFCRRHMALFDRIFEMLYSEDPKVRRSLAAWCGVERLPRGLTPRLP